MSTRDDWTTRVSGTNCPLCAPRPESNDYWDLIAVLSISSLYLAKNQTYRGQCQLVFDARHAARLDQLDPHEYAAFARDLLTAHNAVARAMQPDHMNVESLGNVVPHLHWHVIPRYDGDPHWGLPIWTNPLSAMPDHRLDERARATLIDTIRAALRGEDDSRAGGPR
jgi:diadenosine tetraphosphate (Ap4A) HIT family hydrolase